MNLSCIEFILMCIVHVQAHVHVNVHARVLVHVHVHIVGVRDKAKSIDSLIWTKIE